jgi:hypothetical protein
MIARSDPATSITARKSSARVSRFGARTSRLALTWDDVIDHLLIIDKSWSYGKLKRTKTEKRRTVEIVAPLGRDLTAYRPGRVERGALVIPKADGGHLEINNWRNREWAKAAEKAAITATPYDLRHSFASLLIHEGRSVPVVSGSHGPLAPIHHARRLLARVPRTPSRNRRGDGRRDRRSPPGCAQNVLTRPGEASPPIRAWRLVWLG